jgi:hypothetical protein
MARTIAGRNTSPTSFACTAASTLAIDLTSALPQTVVPRLWCEATIDEDIVFVSNFEG